MVVIKANATLQDIKAAKGTFDPAKDLTVVKKEVLIQYISYLSSQLDAMAELKSTFKETINDIVTIRESAVHAITTTSEEVVSSATNKIEELNVANSKATLELKDKVTELQQFINTMKAESVNSISGIPTRDNVPFTQVELDYINSIEPTSQSENDFVSDDLAGRLLELYTTAEYSNENGHRVVSYGERYTYTGSPKSEETKPIPSVINEVIDLVYQKFPDTPIISQASVNEYNGDGFIAEHSDNEDVLGPESLIYTLTIGETGDIIFKSLQNGRIVEHKAVHKSLYAMTRESQNYWTHRVTSTGKRYALTLRTVSPYYKKSLLVIGDSNACKYKFGTGKGTMGHWTPGKVEFAAKVNDIKPATCNSASYRNILVQVGVNDLKSMNTVTDVNKISERLMEKCNQIVRLNPKCKLYICPVLPTRDYIMNRKIMHMNRYIEMHSKNSFNVTLLDCNDFVDNQGLLRWGFCSKPGDPIHINNTGVSKIVRILKGHIHYKVPYRTQRADGRFFPSRRVDGRPYSGVNSMNSGRVNEPRREGNVRMMNAPTTSNEFPLLSQT